MRADWLVAPHHGGRIADSEAIAKRSLAALVAECSPKSVFFSFGRRDGNELPREENVEIVRAAGCHVRCSQLSIHCASDSELSDLPYPDFHHPAAHGLKRGAKSCCAGTVLLEVESDFAWNLADAHDAFVDQIDPGGDEPAQIDPGGDEPEQQSRPLCRRG
jgi:hypothetical protein